MDSAPSPVSPFFQPSTPAMRVVAVIYKAVFILTVIFFYLQMTSPLHRAGGVVGALTFVLIETFWLTITVEDSAGNVRIVGWSGKLGHSSFAQFWSNVVFCPMVLFFYRSLVTTSVWRILLFPLNIWMLEIIEGYIIMFIFGKNIAWEYRGSDAFCHGNIKIHYAAPWIALGIVVEFVWEDIFLPLALQLQNSQFMQPLLLFCATLTLLFSPRMGYKGIWKSLTGVKQD